MIATAVLPRRVILGLSVTQAVMVTGVPWARAAQLRLKPDQPPVEPDVSQMGDQVRLVLGDPSQPVLLPAARASLLPRLPVAGRDLLALTFAADTASSSADVLAVIGWDGAVIRVLALEAARWQGGTARYACQAASTPNRLGLRLACVASVPRSPTLPFHAAWTDQLAWRDGAPFFPVRSPREAHGLQARIGALRARALDYLATPCRDLTSATVAALGFTDPLGLAAGEAVPDSMTGH